MKNPFFNIIIPSREHADTLPWTLKSCLNQNYENYQIIVVDNFSQDGTFEVVKQFCDSRIKYVNSKKRLSMSHNWEFALQHIEKGFAGVIGDDDGLVKNSLSKLAAIIEETDAAVVRPSNIVYYWPDVYDKNLNGMLFNIPFSNSYSWIDSKKLLNEVAENLEYSHPYFLDLPTIYHGFIDVEIIKGIKQRDGAFLNSCSPDMYSAVIVAAEIDKYIKLEIPVIINGMSAHSNGLSNNLSHINNNEIQKFMSEDIIPFNERLIPKGTKIKDMISRPILVADQFLNAKEKNKSVPDIDIKNLINRSIKSASNWKRQEQFDSVINASRIVARINNEVAFAEKIISAVKYRPGKSERAGTFSFDPTKKLLQIDTLNSAANNVFQISEFIYEITLNKKYEKQLVNRQISMKDTFNITNT